MKRAISLFFMLAIALSVVACQVTPEEPLVVKKDTERMVEQAEEEDSGTQLNDMVVPEGQYTYSTTGAGGKLMIEVTASVTIPNADGIPILHVIESGFSQEMVTGIFNYLYPDQKPYNSVTHTMTKAEVEKLLLHYKKMQAEGSYDKDFYSDEEWQRLIDDTEIWYSTAPETVDEAKPTISDGTMTRVDDGKSIYYTLECGTDLDEMEKYLSIYSYGTDGINQDLAVYDFLFGLTSELHYYRDRFTQYTNENSIQTDGKSIPSEVLDKLAIDFEAAKSLCNGFFAAAGKDGEFQIGNAAYLLNEEGRYALQLIYTRVIDNIATVLITSPGGFGGDDSYALPWGYEYVSFILDEKGITQIEWDNPVTVGEAEGTNVRVMTFDEVIPVFEKMMMTIWEPMAEREDAVAGASELDISVNRISLELCRVKEQNVYGRQGLLVPAWIFYGHTIRTFEDPGGSYSLYDEIGGESQMIGGPVIPILVINAIDGSIIDIGKGY